MEIFFRKSFNAILEMLMSSIRIVPVGSASLNKAVINVDLPAPVRPTIPTLSLGAVLKLIFFKMSLVFSSYLSETSSNSTIPVGKEAARKCGRSCIFSCWDKF